MSDDERSGSGSWPPNDPNAGPAFPAPPPPPPPPDQPEPAAPWQPPPPAGPPQWQPPPPPLPPVPVEPPRWRSMSGLASALTILLWVTAADAVFGIVAYANRVHVINDILNGNFGPDVASRADDADNLVGAAVGIMLLLGLAIFVLFVIWIWRAAKNNEALGRFGARLGPGWAIGGWFIPIANLVIPVLILQDLWRGADPEVARGDPGWRTRRGSALIGWYWAVYIVSFIRFGVGRASARVSIAGQLRGLRAHDIVGIVGMVFGVAAAVLAISVIRRLTARQEECLRAQQDAWRAANPGVA